MININSIETSESVTLLGIEIDNHSNFESLGSPICKKAAEQLNVFSILLSF